MESFYLLVPAAMLLCGVAVGLFIWAVQRHQFDDLENAGRQILFDDDPPRRAPHLPAQRQDTSRKP